MSTPTPKRRSAIDTLVARDRTAVFWFIVACCVAGACAWYITLMAEVLKQRPPFVVMDTEGTYYVPPGIPYSAMDSMHLNLTEVFTETLLERTPESLVYERRLPRLCLDDVLNGIKRDLAKEGDYFRRQQVFQNMEIEQRRVLLRTPTQVKTMSQGKIHRRSFFSGREQSEDYRFTLTIVWKENTGIVFNKAFPSRVRLYELKLEKISNS